MHRSMGDCVRFRIQFFMRAENNKVNYPRGSILRRKRIQGLWCNVFSIALSHRLFPLSEFRIKNTYHLTEHLRLPSCRSRLSSKP